jgi:hypothetical protein
VPPTTSATPLVKDGDAVQHFGDPRAIAKLQLNDPTPEVRSW